MKRNILILFCSLFSIAIAQNYENSSYGQAEHLFIQKNYSQALGILKGIPVNDPFYANALLLQGHIYLNVDSLDQAESSFREILKINANSELAYNGLGLVHYHRISSLKTVVRFFRNIFIKPEAEKSEEMFKKALEINETYEDAQYNLSRLYTRTGGDLEKRTAENVLAGLLRKYPDNYLYASALGDIKLELEKFDEASAIYNKLLSYNPDDGNIQIKLSRILWHEKRYEKFSKHFISGLMSDLDEAILLSLIKDSWDLLSEYEQKLVENDQLQQNILLKFWNKKDPNPVTPINERLIIHYQRLGIARERYRADSFTGYDDRGKIYIKYGEPDIKYEDSFPRFDVKATESWSYKIGRTVVSFDFMEDGSYYTLIDDLTEAINMTSLGKTGLTVLVDMYQNRSHLDGYYQRVADDLLAVDPSSAANVASISNLSPVVMRYKNDRIKVRDDIPVSTYDYALEGTDLPFQMNYAWFYEEQQKFRLELYFALNPKQIVRGKESGAKYPLLKQNIHIQSKDFLTLARGENTIDMNKMKSQDGDYLFQTKVLLTELNPICTIQIENKKSDQRRFIRLPLNIAPKKPEMFAMSSVQLSLDIHSKTEFDPGAFVKNDLFILPYPYKAIRKSNPIYFYFELYDMEKNSKGIAEYQIEYKLYQKEQVKNLAGLLKKINPLNSEERTSVTTNILRRAKEDLIQEYIALDMNALNPGNYRMIIKITSKETGDVVNRQVEFELVD